MRYIFDIETLGLPEAGEFGEAIAAPANYKDPAKIVAYIVEKQAEQVNRASLDLDLCRIVAIGLMLEGSETAQVNLATDANEERGMLTAFWGQLLKDRNPVLVGFNSLGFDLPVIIRRSQYLGVAHPNISLDKYRTPHIDLMQKLTWNGLVRARGLKFYCRRFGIPIEDAVSGADISALVAAGDWDSVRAHCESDVRLTAALARKIGVLAPALEPEQAF